MAQRGGARGPGRRSAPQEEEEEAARGRHGLSERIAIEAPDARRLARSEPVARLATVNPGLGVDIVPITFALVPDAQALDPDEPAPGDRLVSAVDHKPKTTTNLRRLRNIDAHPSVTVLIDHYDDDDWGRLWWVRVRGEARVVAAGDEYDEAVDALVDRYSQYAEHRPAGPAIVVDDLAWTGWRS